MANAEQYKPDCGMEDGFELYSDVVTKSWIVTDNLIKITRPDGRVVTPYIKHRRGRTFICEGDYIRTVSLLSLSGKKTLRPPHLRSLRTS